MYFIVVQCTSSICMFHYDSTGMYKPRCNLIHKFAVFVAILAKAANNRREETFARHSIPSLAAHSRDRYVCACIDIPPHTYASIPVVFETLGILLAGGGS